MQPSHHAGKGQDHGLPICDAVSAVLEDLSQRCMDGNHSSGVQTGFKDLDRYLNGMQGGDLGVIAARPATGKTSFMLNVALHAALQGVRVIYISLEVDVDRLTKRLLAMQAQVDYERLEKGNPSSEDISALTAASAELADCNIYLTDDPIVTVSNIEDCIRTELSDDSERSLVLIDYLQLIKPEGHCLSYGNRTYEVDDVVRNLKWVARELNVPMLVASSLSRAAVERESSRPVLTDLRESGSIEQVADYVVFIDRSLTEDEAEDSRRPAFGEAKMIIAKNRHGNMGECSLAFDPVTLRFSEYLDESAWNVF